MTPYFWLGIFLIVGYFVVTDRSVATFFILMEKLVRIEYEKIKWKIFQNPRNPIVKYLIWRRSMKLAQKLQKEFDNANNT